MDGAVLSGACIGAGDVIGAAMAGAGIATEDVIGAASLGVLGIEVIGAATGGAILGVAGAATVVGAA